MSITNVLCYWEKYSLGLLWIEIQLFGDQFTTCFNSLLLKYLTNKRRQTCLFSAPRIMQMSNSKKNSSMLNNSLIRWLTNITCLLFWSSKIKLFDYGVRIVLFLIFRWKEDFPLILAFFVWQRWNRHDLYRRSLSTKRMARESKSYRRLF